MKITLTLDIEGTEQQQDDGLSELWASRHGSEVVKIHTAAEVVEAVILDIQEA